MAKTEYYEGRPIFKANTSHQLAEAVAKFKGNVEAPYVVMVSSKKVKDDAFHGDKTVGVALFEEGKVTIIGTKAFAECPALTTVVIPKSVEEIWQMAFAGCSALEKITVAPGNSRFDSRENCNAIITDENYLRVGCKTTIIPDTVTEIGAYSFGWIQTLTKINIPASVKRIRKGAFKCSTLAEIDLPESIERIDEEAFRACNNLTNVTLPRSLKEIGHHAFFATSITKINIPKGVKEIGPQAFGLHLTGEIVVPNTVESLCHAFAYCNELTKVIINSGPDVNMYGTFEGCTFITSVGPIGSGASVELRTRVKNIDKAFEKCTALTDITLPEETIKDMPIFKANNSKELADAVIAFDGEVNPPYIVQVSAEKIEGGAFSYNEEVGGVILEETVKEIGNNAFCMCKSLRTISIPNNVTNIGQSAFSNCSNLEKATFVDLQQLLNINFEGWSSNPLEYAHHLFFAGSEEEVTDIIIPDGTTKIGDYTFNGCSDLVSVTIPQSVKSIGVHAFSGCSALTSIMLTNSIKTISMYAFSECGFTSVTIPNSIKKIDEGVFEGCEKLESVELPDSIKSIGLIAFQDCESLTSITIPDSVTKIGVDAFLRCKKLESVTIGDGVKTISKEAFRECKSLKSVFLGSGVEKIEGKAFEKCKKILVIQSLAPHAPKITDSTFEFDDLKKTALYVPKDSIGYYRNASYWKWFKKLAEADDKVYKVAPDTPRVIIPDGITKIGDYAFCGCTHVTSVEIPDSVKEIGKYAFEECVALSAINIPNSVTKIEEYAFRWCKGLTSIVIPNSVSEIHKGAFEYCSGLTSITIPNSVTSIESSAFEGCRGLTSITIPDSVESIGEDAFEKCYMLQTNIHSSIDLITKGLTRVDEEQSDGLLIKENTVVRCRRSATSITIPDSVTSIGEDAFEDCRGLTSITIPDSVTSIGRYAFSGCRGLTSITIPDSVTSIGDFAFRGCDGLTSITIPDSVTSIGRKAFSGCDGLTSITIPDSVTSIGEDAFEGCSGLTSITIPDSVTSIGRKAFWGCDGLTSITIPDSVTSIGNFAFGNCYMLQTNIHSSIDLITKGLTRVDEEQSDGLLIKGNTVVRCRRSATSITIPDSVESIEDHAFSGCERLKTITIPDSVKSIGEDAFEDCPNLKEIRIKDKSLLDGTGID